MLSLKTDKLKRLLIIGKTGQLARALIKLCESHDIDAVALGRETLDLSWDDTRIRDALKAYEGCDALINAAAYTAVDAAENDETIAHRVNAKAPETFAQFCQQNAMAFVHISTDYVFNGEGHTPYKVDHGTEPLGIYGKTKRSGETTIQNVEGQFAIIRTSWVYDGIGKNFMTTMLRLAESRDTLNVVHDQKGRPTYAPDLAHASLILANALCEGQDGSIGLFHVSNSGPIISWADFARAIFEQAKPHLGKEMLVKNITSKDYPTPAKRPGFSALDISKFEQLFETQLPDWSSSLETAISVWKDHKV